MLEAFKKAGYYLYKLTNDYIIQAYLTPPNNCAIRALPELNATFDLLASKKTYDLSLVADS